MFENGNKNRSLEGNEITGSENDVILSRYLTLA
jgi:hypothetical protein